MQAGKTDVVSQDDLEEVLRTAVSCSDVSPSVMSSVVSGMVLESGDVLIMLDGHVAGIHNSNKILSSLCTAFLGSEHDVILDLSQCLHLASYALGELAKLAVDLKKRGHAVVIMDANDLVKSVLELAGLDMFVQVKSSREEE